MEISKHILSVATPPAAGPSQLSHSIPLDFEFNSKSSFPTNPSQIKVYILQWSVWSQCFSLQLKPIEIELTLNIFTWVTEHDVVGSLQYFPPSVQQSWNALCFTSPI